MNEPSCSYKLGFKRNEYNRVSFVQKEVAKKIELDQNAELLRAKIDQKEPPIPVSGVDYINLGEEDQMEVYGYRSSPLQTAVTWLFICLTFGVLRLVFHWWPQLMLFATHKRCSLNVAEKVLVVEKYLQKHQSYYVKNVSILSADTIMSQENVWGNEVVDSWDDQALNDIHPTRGLLSLHISNGIFKECEFVRLFLCKKLCYIWDEDKCEFFKLAGLDEAVSTACLHQQQGLTLEGQKLRRVVYGNNEIVVPVKGIITLLFLEVLNPFYVFQLFSFCLWFADNYVYYALTILAMSAFGIIMAIIQTRKNQFNLRSTVHSSDVAMVLRKSLDQPESIPTEHLVPGDILVIPRHGGVMHCDAVLLAGNCIMNESMLTGESVPVTKTPLPNSPDILYDSKEHVRHTLFCGTQVIQTRYFGNELVLAIVIRTGFSTAKGSLVRSIMYPPPVDFKFEHDSYKFVELLAAIASIGFVYTVITKFMRGISLSNIVLKALDLITIVVPPALPAAMTVGRYYAQSRLENKGIYCISPRTINVSGSIDCVCFDKTGTLTEDGLDMWGVVPVTDRKFQVPVKFIDKMIYDDMIFGMVTCHSLTIIDGKLSGDPLDLKMFHSTGWLLEEPEVNDSSKFEMIFPTIVRPPKTNEPSSHSIEEEYFSDKPPLEIGIVRQFPFSSSLQRMSVISRRLGASHFHVYCKGSPETILSLSMPDTIPIDTSTVLEEYTQEGYRVLALAYRELRKLSYAKAQRLLREEVEINLIFLGLIVMENRLKQGTSATLIMLREANIRTIMVTGDNMLTALSVARDCGIVPFGQRVIVASALPPTSSTPAQLYYMHANNPGTSSDTAVDTQHITNNTSISNIEASDLESNNSYTLCSSPNDYFQQAFSSNSPSSYCFVMTGKTWALARTYFPEIIPKLVTRGAVFARMNPDQKQNLVQELQLLGYYVAMCGDGANDCGALKAAHAGISLSDAESSVASPFTSKNPDISCVPEVIREGRAALVTSFGIFKYMAAYSLTQFVSVMILYSIDNNLSDIEFLYIDLFVITVFAFFFGRTEAFDGHLANAPPILSLISLSPILSLVLQITLVIQLQYLSFYCVQQAPWFYPFNATSGEVAKSVACYENYTLFSISSMQYIILALVFSKGAPYRKSIFSNYGFSVSLIVLSTFTLYLILAPHNWIHEMFELIIPPMSFRLIMAGFGFLNLVLAAFIDYFIIDYIFVKKLRYRYQNIEKSRRKFLALEKEMAENVSWPSISKDHGPDPAPEVSWHPPHSPATISKVHVESESKNLTSGTLPFMFPSTSSGTYHGPDPAPEVSWHPRSPATISEVHVESESKNFTSGTLPFMFPSTSSGTYHGPDPAPEVLWHPPRSPATISEVHVESESKNLTSGTLPFMFPSTSSGTYHEKCDNTNEVTLNPSSLFIPEKRSHSDAQINFDIQSELNLNLSSNEITSALQKNC